MKKISLIIASLIICNFIYAKKKYVIVTSKPVSSIELINNKTKSKISLYPIQKDNKNYMFELNSLSNIYILSSETVSIRIYSVLDSISTSWHKIEKNKAVAIKPFFKKNTYNMIKLKEFYIKSFYTEPLVSTKSELRSDEEIFFHIHNNYNFSEPKKLNISWKSKFKVLEIKIIDKTNFSQVYKTKLHKDTVFLFSNIDIDKKKRLKQARKYLMIIKAEYKTDLNYRKTGRYKLDFEFNPIVFAVNKNVQYFLTKQNIKFAWQSPTSSVDILVFDNNEKLIFSKKNFSKKYFDIENFNKNNIKIEKLKQYIFVLQSGDNKIYKKFYVLLNNTKQISLINQKP